MQIVIDINEEDFKCLENGFFISLGRGNCKSLFNRVMNAIINGAPLPKGHGRLIDISKIDEDRIEKDNPVIYLTIDGNYTEAISLDYLNSLPTIIEADKVESED